MIMREQLAEGMGPIEFDDLRAHLTRGAVITVSAKLDLLDVGEAVARDEKARVEAWIASGDVGKPSLETIERWSKSASGTLVSLVVQPFVLVQERLS